MIAVLFIDVDHFKAINDEYGHATGDEALTLVASTLATLVRPNDLVARVGGDEFTILLDGLHDGKLAHKLAERITRKLCGAWQVNGHDLTLSVSTGVSTSMGKLKTATELLRAADAAMYQAKRNGRAGWSAVEPDRASTGADADAPLDTAS